MRWAVPVPLLEDELLSSWLVRAAMVQGCDPLVLTGCLWPRWRVWTLDIDRGIPPERVAALAEASGVDAYQIHQAGLAELRGVLHGGTSRCATWPWILTQGARGRRHRSSLPYCPHCMAEDATPYFRRSWRWAWRLVCPAHQAVMRDRCPQCGDTVEPHRLVAADERLDRCTTCSADLRKAALETVDAQALDFQSRADMVLQRGGGAFGGVALFGPEWFALARFLTGLIRHTRTRRPRNLEAFLAHLDVATEPCSPVRSSHPLESLSVSERASLLGKLPPLLDACASQWQVAARAEALTVASFSGIQRRTPVAFLPLLESLPRGGRPRRTSDAIRSCAQTPRSILQRCARIQQRLGA